jgi:hypothetical protein
MMQVTEQAESLMQPPSLAKVLSIVRRHFAVRDMTQYVIVLGTAAAHYVPGPMLWLRVIGASRAGKTELLSALAGHSDVAEMEHITPASLRGGFSKAPKVLERIDGKITITKDIAAMMGARAEDRNTTFALLRNIKDGSLTSDFNSEEGYLSQQAEFDWLLGMTDGAMAQGRVMQDTLGARFIDLAWVSGERTAAARRAARNTRQLKAIRAELKEGVHSLLNAVKGRDPVPFDDVDALADIADVTSWCRSPVIRRTGGDVVAVPKPELGTDMAQGFVRVAGGLSLLGIADPLPYIIRLARDSIPSGRREVLFALSAGVRSNPDLARAARLPLRATRRHLEDLQCLDVVTRTRDVVKECAGAIKTLSTNSPPPGHTPL